jgi:4'-phosphopantetheinyl transferase
MPSASTSTGCSTSFAASPRSDAIPPLRAGCCQLWWGRASAAGPHLLELLDEDEHRRHARFLRAEDRALFLVAHALTRIVAGGHVAVAPRAIRYCRQTAEHDKPRFAGEAAELEFSISHSGERVVVAVSATAALGVDVERVRSQTVEPSLLESVLCAPEQRELAAMAPATQAWAFCHYWTRKEAVLKATGDGLAVSPTQIMVTPPTRAPALVRWSGPQRPAAAVHLYDLDAEPGYTASLATIGSALERTEHDANALLRAWA